MPSPRNEPDRDEFRARFLAKLKEEESKLLDALRERLSDGGERPRDKS